MTSGCVRVCSKTPEKEKPLELHEEAATPPAMPTYHVILADRPPSTGSDIIQEAVTTSADDGGWWSLYLHILSTARYDYQLDTD